MRRLLASAFEDMLHVEKRLQEVNHEIEAIAARSDTARRLMTIPGIGRCVL